MKLFRYRNRLILCGILITAESKSASSRHSRAEFGAKPIESKEDGPWRLRAGARAYRFLGRSLKWGGGPEAMCAQARWLV